VPTLIVGGGGVGLFLTYLLGDEHDAHVLARGVTLERLRTEGFVVFDGGAVHPVQVPAMDWDEWRSDDRAWDVLVAVKAGDLDPVLQELAKRPDGVGCLFLLQNGLGIMEQAERVLPDAPMVRVSCYTGVEREAPTAIRVHGRGPFRVAAVGAGKARLDWISQALSPEGFPVQVVGSPHRMEWEKAMMNLVVNGICTVVATKNGAVLDEPLRALAEEVLDECLAVSRARGVEVKATMKADVFAAVANVRDNSNSTLQDLLGRRSTELDVLHGRVVAWGDELGVPTPATQTLYRLLTFLEGDVTGTGSASPWPRSIWPHPR
jgi:2-dehydropantoate 2-reductase